MKKDIPKFLLNTGLNILTKKLYENLSSVMGSGITLTNNEMKYIIEIIKLLENRGIWLKENTEKNISKEGELLSNFLGPLMSVSLLLMKNVLKQLAKIVSLQLRLTAATSATDASFKKKIYGARITTPIISIEEIKDIIKIIKSLAESGLLMKSVSDIAENEVKEQKVGYAIS